MMIFIDFFDLIAVVVGIVCVLVTLWIWRSK